MTSRPWIKSRHTVYRSASRTDAIRAMEAPITDGFPGALMPKRAMSALAPIAASNVAHVAAPMLKLKGTFPDRQRKGTAAVGRGQQPRHVGIKGVSQLAGIL